MSETAKHTPGPWFWALDKHGQATSLRRSGSGDCVVSPQADVGDYGLSVNPWNDVSEADACLIAAAPALLEALQAVWWFIDRHDDTPAHLAETVLRALRKAEGATP